MEIVTGFLIVVNCFLIGIIIRFKIDNEYYINEYERCTREIARLETIIKIYQKREQYSNYLYQNKSKNIYDNDIKEAVKYAMKKSHPDNDGSSDEFNKFRELYNKIK